MSEHLFTALCLLGVYGRRWQVAHRLTAGLPLGVKDQIVLDNLTLGPPLAMAITVEGTVPRNPDAATGLGSEGEYIAAGLRQLDYVINSFDLSADGQHAAEALHVELLRSRRVGRTARGVGLDNSRVLLLQLVKIECPDEAAMFSDAVEAALNEGTNKP